MTVERLAPDAILEQTNLSGALTAIDEDPDSSDASWLTASSNNAQTVARVSFPTPSGSGLTPGAGLQEFRVLVRKIAGQSGNPQARVELYENGSLVSTLVADTTITSTTGTVLAGTWDATGRDRTTIECRVVGTQTGGNPSTRNTVEVGAIEWNADYTSSTPGDATANLVTVSVSALAATADGGSPLVQHASDNFERAETDAWGNATSGEPWIVDGGATATGFDVTGGVGRMSFSASGVVRNAVLDEFGGTVQALDAEATYRFLVSEAAVGSQLRHQSYQRRQTNGDQYRFETGLMTDGSVRLTITKQVTGVNSDVFAEAVISGLTWSPDTYYQVKTQAEGTGTTSLRWKMWEDGTSEPSSWHVETTHSESALDSGGTTGFRTQVPSGYTGSFPVNFDTDDLSLHDIGYGQGPEGTATVNLVTVNVNPLSATADGGGGSGFPTVAGSVTSANTLNSLTPTYDLPASIGPGDLIIVVVARDGATATATWPGSWVELVDAVGAAQSGHIAYLIASGGETSVIPTFTVAEHGSAIALRITNWHGTTPPEVSTEAASGTTDLNPNPNSLSPSWGAEDTLWIAAAVADGGNGPGPVVSWPTSYADNQLEESGGGDSSGAFVALATRELNASSDDPGAFALTAAETWQSWLIAVRPAAGGGTPGDATAGLVTVTTAVLAPTATGAASQAASLATVGVVALSATAAGSSVGNATAGLASVSVTALSATATGGVSVSANTNLVTISLSGLAATSTGAAAATAGLAQVTAQPLSATASGGGAGTATVNLATVGVAALSTSASGAGTAAVSLVTITSSVPPASASGAASTAPSLQTVAASALAPSASGAATAGASLVSLTVTPLAATASGGSSIPGDASANLVSISLTPITATTSGEADIQVSLPVLTVSTLSVDSSGAAVATANLVSLTLSALPATAAGGGAANAVVNLVVVSLSALPTSASGGAQVSTGLGSVTASPLSATASGGTAVPGTANTSLVTIAVSALSASAVGACSAPASLASLAVTPLSATAVGAAIAAVTGGTVTGATLGASGHGAGRADTQLVGIGLSPLSPNANGAASASCALQTVGVIALPATAASGAFATAGLAVISISALPISPPGSLYGVGAQLPTLRGKSRPAPTLVGATATSRPLIGRTSSGPTIDGSSSTESTLTGTTGSTENN